MQKIASHAVRALALTLTIQMTGAASAAAASFALTPTTNPLTLPQNAGGTDSITVTNTAGFGGAVTLSVSGAPAGVSTALAGNLLIVYPSPATPVGTYPLTITGTSGATTVTTTLQLVITPGASFTLTPAASSLSVVAGATVSSAITIAPVAGFTGQVSFTATGLPAGAAASFTSAGASGTTLNVTTATTTPPGSYRLSVTGSVAATGNSAALTQTTSVTLNVTSAMTATHPTICQTQPGGSYCSDQAPGAADAAGYHDLGWTNLGKSLTAISVSDDQVWGIDAAQTLWFLPNFKQSTSWIPVMSGVTQISTEHDLACVLTTNAHLLCATSANPQQGSVSWTDTGPTTLVQIAVSAGRQLWGVDANSNVVRITDYTNVAASSTYVAAGVRQVAVDGRGTVCQVNSNGNVYCSNASVPAAVANPAPYHSLPWVNTGLALSRIAVADGIVWGVDGSANIWQLPDYKNSSTWYRIAYAGSTTASVAAASVPSQFQPSDFAAGEVAVLVIMGQSNSVGHDVIPTRFISAASPHVWTVNNAGWNFLPGNTNGAGTAFTGSSASIGSVAWIQVALTPTGPDLDLGFNNNPGPAGNAANFAAYDWQGLIDAGWPLPDLYIIHIAWPSQGVDPADATTAVAAWTTHGINLWQPALKASQMPSYALAPFARTILYRGLQNLLSVGKTPRIIGLQWNQWEAEAGNANPISITDAPANYTALFGSFATTIGTTFPIQFIKPLSTYFSAAVLAEMQTVFTNLAAADPVDRSILDVSQVSSTIFSGGVYGGGDGSIHYNLDTQQWFGAQAVATCITAGRCGTRVISLPAMAPN